MLIKLSPAPGSHQDASWREGVRKTRHRDLETAGLRAAPSAAILLVMAPLLETIVRRPLTRACWIETLYLLVGVAVRGFDRAAVDAEVVERDRARGQGSGVPDDGDDFNLSSR